MPTYYQIHTLAELFPEMTEDQFSALVSDIQANGQQEPGLLFQNKLIDGRHRQKACQLLGIEFVAHEYKPNESPTHDEALNAIVSRNLLRRHMTTSERGYMAAKIASAKQGRPTRKLDCNTINDPEKQIVGIPTIIQAAEICGVSVDSAKIAKAVIQHGSEQLNLDVQQGRKSLNQAEKELKQQRPRKPSKITRNASKTTSVTSTLNLISKLLISLHTHTHTTPQLQHLAKTTQQLINDLNQN